MNTKVFATYKDFKLIGDVKDIAVDWRLRKEVFDWSIENRIHLEYQGSSKAAQNFGVDLWRVKEEQQRVLFLLKWGDGSN